MNASDFTALLVLATAMSFTPGPNTTLATTLGANLGLRGAMPFVLAVPVGWGALLTLCTLGLGSLLLAAPVLTSSVKVLGIGYLLWLAWKLWSSRPQPVSAGAPAEALNVTFAQGVMLQFLNIKAWMFALAVISGWIAGRDEPQARFAVVLPVMLLYALASNLLYAAVGSLLRVWLSGPGGTGARLRVFNRVMGAVLAVTAAWMMTV